MAERSRPGYRLLNEQQEAESICLGVIAAKGDNQDAAGDDDSGQPPHQFGAERSETGTVR